MHTYVYLYRHYLEFQGHFGFGKFEKWYGFDSLLCIHFLYITCTYIHVIRSWHVAYIISYVRTYELISNTNVVADVRGGIGEDSIDQL